MVNDLINYRELRQLIRSLEAHRNMLNLLREVMEDPDTLAREYYREEARRLEEELTRSNLIVEIWPREDRYWLDTPPPERDPDLGIRTRYA